MFTKIIIGATFLALAISALTQNWPALWSNVALLGALMKLCAYEKGEHR